MGYRISYENGRIKKHTVKEHRIGFKPIGIGLTSAALAITMMVPQGRLWLRDLLLPGDEEITAAALDSMVDQLRQGEPVEEALEAFCKEILAGGA